MHILSVFISLYCIYYGWAGVFILYDILSIQPQIWHIPALLIWALDTIYPALKVTLEKPKKWLSCYPIWTLVLMIVCQFYLKSVQEPVLLILLGSALVALYPCFICYLNPLPGKHYKLFAYSFVYGSFILAWILCGAQGAYFSAAVTTCIFANECLIAYPLFHKIKLEQGMLG